MRPIRLVIADRRPIVLQGFASLFAAERDFAIVASCLDGAGCLKAVRTLMPDLVLVEDGFSDVTASELLGVVKAENIPTRLVFYTASVAQGDLAAAIAAGACCGVSMREDPETWMQTLRLVAPSLDHATAVKKENGASGENALELTDQDRKIMRLVAYGMSNKQIARQLQVSLDIIKARLDDISTRLEIKGRREVATFALSRLYGGLGALAALIYALLDDVKAAHASASSHESPDTFAVMTADGTGEVITIKIDIKKTAAASGKTVKAPFKAGREDNNPTSETPARAGKLIQSSIDISPGTITPPALNAARPALGSFSTFMATVAGVWFYEVLNNAAKAFNLSSTAFASATPSDTGESVAVNSPGSADATVVNFDRLAWVAPEASSRSFAFAAPGSDTVPSDSADLQIAAYASEDSVNRNGTPYVGSGAVDAPQDHGGEQAAATDAPANAKHDSNKAAAAGESPGQSQRDLHAAEDGGPPAKQQGKHDLLEEASDREQTQHDSDASPGDSPAAEHNAKDDAKDDAKHDAKGHVKDDAEPATGANLGQSQKELHPASANASENEHAGSKQSAGGKDKAADDSGHAQKAVAPEPGDSFHFKNEAAASDASHVSEVHGGHGPDSNEHGQHTAANGGPTPAQDAGLPGPSHPEQTAVDHAKGAEHHMMHDLLV